MRSRSTRDDADAPRVAIVNESFVRKYFEEGEEPLGRSLVYGNWWAGGPPEYQIVGIVADVNFSGRTESPPPATYFPHAQQPVREMNLLLRAEGDPWDLVDSVRAATRALDTTLPVDNVATLEELLAETESSRRSIALALALFAAVVLFLGAVSCISTWIPARRATRIDPMVSLRGE